MHQVIRYAHSLEINRANFAAITAGDFLGLPFAVDPRTLLGLGTVASC